MIKLYTINDIVSNRRLAHLGIHNWSQIRELISHGLLKAERVRRPVGRPAWVVSEASISEFCAFATERLGELSLIKKRNKKYANPNS